MVSAQIYFGVLKFEGDYWLMWIECLYLNFHAEDGKLMADPETGEFWGFFGGFAPLPRKTASDDDKPTDSRPPKLLW